MSVVFHILLNLTVCLAGTNMGCSESKADSGASNGNKPEQQQQDAGDGNQQAR